MELSLAIERAARLESLPFLLVSGVGRSGTTVTTRALQQHPQILSNGVESNVMFDVIEAARVGCTLPSRMQQMVRDQESYDAIFRRMLFTLLFDLEEEDRESFAAVSTYSAMTKETAEYAFRLFPRMILVYLLRNGIEVVSSRMQHRSFRHHSFDDHCVIWKRSVEMSRWGVNQSQFVLLRQENLLTPQSLKTELDSLFNRCGLEISQETEDYFLNRNVSRIKFTTRFPGESEAQRKQLESRSQRWYLWTDQQRTVFREICGESMRDAGYEIPDEVNDTS